MIEYDNRYYDYSNGNLNVKNNSNSMGDWFGIGQAIGGIAGAIGTYAASKQNRRAQEETNAANLALARQQNDWNIQQWEREMDYNSPANKLRLLEEAGLNPIWYGANLGPTETQAPKSAELANQVAPQLDTGAIGSSLSNLTSSLIASGSYYLQRQQQKLEQQKIDIEKARLENEKVKVDQDVKESEKRIERYGVEIENLQKDGKLKEQDLDNAKKQLQIMEDQHQVAQEQLKGIQLDNQQKQMFLDQYADVLEAELNIKKAQAKELAAAAYNYIMSAEKSQVEKYGLELMNRLTEDYGELDTLGGIVSKGVGILSKIPGVGKYIRKAGKFVGLVDDDSKPKNNGNSTTNPKPKNRRKR